MLCGQMADEFVNVDRRSGSSRVPRRYLVDYGILDRENAGDYWLLGAWRVPASQ